MKMYLRYLFRLKADEFFRRHRLCFLMIFSLFLTSLSGFAQGTCDPLSISGVNTSAADCPSSGTATIAASGTSLTYKLVSGPLGYPTSSNNTGIFNSLGSGEYIVEVTDGCSGSVTRTFTVTNAYPAFSVASATIVSGTLCSVSTPTGGQLRGTVTGGKSTYQYDFVKLVDGNPVSAPTYSSPTAATEHFETVSEFGVYRFYALDACGEVRTMDISVLSSTALISNVVLSGFRSTPDCNEVMDGRPISQVDIFLRDASGATINWDAMAGAVIEIWKPAGDIVNSEFNCSMATDYLIHTYSSSFGSGHYASFKVPQEDIIIIIKPPCGEPIKYCLPFTSVVPIDLSRIALMSNSCTGAFEDQRYDIYFDIREGQPPYTIAIRDKDGILLGTETRYNVSPFFLNDYVSHDQLPLTIEVTDKCGTVQTIVVHPPAASESTPITAEIEGRNYCQAQEGTLQVVLTNIRGYIPGRNGSNATITGGPVWATPHIVPVPWNLSSYILEGLVVGYTYTITWTNICGDDYVYTFDVPSGGVPGTVTYEANIATAVDALCGQNAANVSILDNSNLSTAHTGYRVFSLEDQSGAVYGSNSSGIFTNVPPGEYKAKWLLNWEVAGVGNCPTNIIGDSTSVTVLGDGLEQSVVRKTVLLCEDGTGLPSDNGKAIIEVNGAPPFTYEIIRKAVLDANPATTAWVVSASGVSSNTYTWNLPLPGDPLETEYVLRSVDKCENKITTQASLQPLAPPTFESDMMPCVGTLNYTMAVVPYAGDFEYRWVKLSDPTVTLSTSNSLTLSGAYTSSHDGTYRCYVTLDGCIERYIDRVLNSTVPGFTVSANEACVGESVTLTATGGSTYLWEGPNGFTSAAASVTLDNLTLAHSGTYKVTVTNAEGCALSSDTLITVAICDLTIPELTSGVICEGEEFTLSGTCDADVATLAWFTDEAGTIALTNLTVSPTVTTVYYARCELGAAHSDLVFAIVTVTPAELCVCEISATAVAVCHDNGTLEDTSDDYMTFLLTPSGGKLGGRFTLTATQGGSPIVVTLSDGTAHAALSYTYPTPFRTPVGSAGGGNIILTLTDTEDANCNTTVTITDTGVCGTDECVGDTPRTVTYMYRTPFQTTDLQNVGIIIPKFNEADKTLTQVEIKYGIEEANNYIVENTADRDQNYKLDVEMLATIKMGSDTLEHISETFEGEVVRLASYIDVAAQGNYTGDVPYSSSTPPRLSTIQGMGVWLSNLMADIYVDPKQDPRWVTNATGNASHDDDIYVKGTDEIVAEGEKIYTSAADIAQFLGSGNLPLTASTLNSHLIIGGGGNNVWLLRTKAFAYATVTYTYICNSCETPDAGVDIAMDCEEELPETVALIGAPTGGTWSVDPSNPAGTAVSAAGVASGFATAGTYKFIYSVSQGGEVCKDTVQVSISLKPAPPVLTPVEVCQGETVELEGTCSGAGSIKWYSNAELTNEVTVLSFAGTESGTYFAVCADAECTSSSTSVEVTVNTTPTISIAGPAVCATDGLTYSATVTATAGAVITSSAGVVSGNTVSGIPSGTTATITATIGTCSDSTTVSQNCTVPCEAPNPTVTGSATVCEGGSAALEASGCTTGYTYLWSTGAITASVTVTPTATTTYTVVCVDGDLAGCESTAAGEVTVTVTEVPTISIAGPAVCATDGLTYSATVTATAGAVITSSAGVVSGNTVSGIPSRITATITATIGTCSDSTTVSQNCTVPCEAPNPTVTGSATVCEGESATLEASGCTAGYTYLWSTGATTARVTVTPTATATYTVVCVDSDLAGCESTAAGEATVTVTEVPTISIAGPAVCTTDGLTYSATVTATAGAVITSSAGVVSGNTVSGIPSGTTATITATIGTCSDSTTVSQNCTAEIFDLALRKVLPNGAKNPTVAPGSTVTFKIEVWNQGTVAAQNIAVVDYIPEGLILADANWTPGTGMATLTNPIAALAAGDSTSVNISFTVDADFTGSIRNFAEISGADNIPGLPDVDSTPDTDPDNDGMPKDDEINNAEDDEDDHDYEDITVSPAPVFDLALRKVLPNGAKNPTVTPGSTVTFKIEVWNQGTVAAQNIAVVDYIPEGLTLADGNWTPGTGVATLTSPIVALAAGDSTSVNISFTVNTDFTGSIRNFAEISGADNIPGLPDVDSTPDTDPDNDGTPKDDEINNAEDDEDDHDYEDITVSPAPVFDLALRKVLPNGVKNPPVTPGSTVTFKIEVWNQGTVAAQNIAVIDYIPEGLTLADGNWTPGTGVATLTNPIAALAAGDSTSVNISFTVNADFTGSIRNFAEISGADNIPGLPDVDSTPDTNPDNDGTPKDDEINNEEDDEDDHDYEDITVSPAPVFDLALRKTMAPGSKTIYKVGDEVTFNITVFNQGTVTATSVDLVDYIPAGLTLEDDNWTQDGDKARWVGAVTNLAPGAQQTVQITFVINSSATGVVVNTAEISGATNPENLEDKDSTPDDDKDNDGDAKNDVIDEDGKDGRDEDDHDIEPITICLTGKCITAKVKVNK